MKKLRIAINGAGRIGRAFYKLSRGRDDIEVVAFNDLGDIENIAYLLKYDSAYGVSDFDVTVKGNNLIIDGKEIAFVSEKEPENLPWGKMNIDIVIESTGVFTKYELARKHITAGAKRVIISAPAKDDSTSENERTILLGINDEKFSVCDVTSNASCTTNAGSPLMAILDESVGIEKALLNTVHAYTATQSIVDGPAKKDLRNGRAAAHNIIPSSTGAAIAVTKALPQLSGKFDGISLRVPVIVGSIVDITFISKRNTTAEEIKDILKKASQEDRWKGIFTVSEEPLVSSDIVGNTHASIADLDFVRVVDGNLVKVLAWYDNEMGYTYTLLQHALKLGSYIK